MLRRRGLLSSRDSQMTAAKSPVPKTWIVKDANSRPAGRSSACICRKASAQCATCHGDVSQIVAFRRAAAALSAAALPAARLRLSHPGTANLPIGASLFAIPKRLIEPFQMPALCSSSQPRHACNLRLFPGLSDTYGSKHALKSPRRRAKYSDE